MPAAAAEHLAALAYQLPRDGRTWRAVDPARGNGEELLMLRRIEHNQRLWHWAHTKDAQQAGTVEPQPVLLPGEEEAYEAAEERQVRAQAEVASAFGLKI